MSQPPGHFGVPPGPSGPTPPPYAPGGPGGRPGNRALPWLIVGAAVLLSALGLLLVLLFMRDDVAPRAAAPAASTAPPTSSSPVPPRTRDAGGLAGGATSTASPHQGVPRAGAEPRYEGSGDVALAWVRAMADGDFEAAFAGSCPAVQQAAVDADDGSGPAWALATYFFEQTLGGVGFTEGSFDSLVHDAASSSDLATFTLTLDNGQAFPLLVYVGPDLTVCDFR